MTPVDKAHKRGNYRPRTESRGLRQRAWWVIRKRQSFTLYELLDVLATGRERDATSNLGKYLRALAGAGILSIDEKLVSSGAATSPGLFRYHLEINNGRLAPVVRISCDEVYDPNKAVSYPIRRRGDA